MHGEGQPIDIPRRLNRHLSTCVSWKKIQELRKWEGGFRVAQVRRFKRSGRIAKQASMSEIMDQD